MSRTRNDALHAQRHEDILQAAATVFRAKGFHLARTEDICVAAGLSAGTLFRHFPDKRSMIMAIAEIEFDRYKSDIAQLATQDGIRRLATVTGPDLVELLQPKGFELGTDSWLELARDAEGKKRLRAFDKKLRSALTKELVRGQSDGWVRKSLDCQGAANVILALFSGLMFDQELGLTVDLDSTARSIADLVGGLLQPE